MRCERVRKANLGGKRQGWCHLAFYPNPLKMTIKTLVIAPDAESLSCLPSLFREDEYRRRGECFHLCAAFFVQCFYTNKAISDRVKVCQGGEKRANEEVLVCYLSSSCRDSPPGRSCRCRPPRPRLRHMPRRTKRPPPGRPQPRRPRAAAANAPALLSWSLR